MREETTRSAVRVDEAPLRASLGPTRQVHSRRSPPLPRSRLRRASRDWRDHGNGRNQQQRYLDHQTTQPDALHSLAR